MSGLLFIIGVQMFRLRPRPRSKSFYKCLCTLDPNKIFRPYVPIKLVNDSNEKLKDAQAFEALYHSSVKSHKEILIKQLDISEDRAQHMLYKNFKLRNTDVDYLDSTLSLLKEVLPFTFEEDSETWIKILSESKNFIHTIHVMKELSIPLTPSNIFSDIRSQTIENLRKKNLIPSDLDIPKTIFTQLEAPENILKSLSTIKYEHLEFIMLWQILQKRFLNWQLNWEHEKILRLNQRFQKILYSLHFFKKNLKLLRKHDSGEFSISIFSVILTMNPIHFEKYIKVSLVCGISLRRLMEGRSKHTVLRLRHMKAMNDHIQGKPPNYLRCNELLPSTMRDRILFLMNLTSLTDLRLTPNYFVLLRNFTEVERSLKHCESMSKPITSLPTINLLRALKSGHVPSNRKKLFLAIFVHCFLGIKRPKVLLTLQDLGMLYFPSVEDVKRNYMFLTERFELDVIRNSYQVMLFPHDLLIKCFFEDLRSMKYAEEFLKANEADKLLQLLLYKLHKDYFTMGGCS